MLSVGTYCFLKHEVRHEVNFSKQKQETIAIYEEVSNVLVVTGPAYGNPFGSELALLADMIWRLFEGFLLMCWRLKKEDGTNIEAYCVEHC